MRSVLTLLLWSGIALGQTTCFVRDSKGHETKEPCHKTVCVEGCEKTNGSWPVPALVDDTCHKPTACRPEELGYGWTEANGGVTVPAEGVLPFWTCADTTRILEHNEQTPPKYWCRKVQP